MLLWTAMMSALHTPLNPCAWLWISSWGHGHSWVHSSISGAKLQDHMSLIEALAQAANRMPGSVVTLVLLSSSLQGDGKEDSISSSISDSDLQEVTAPPAPCWGLDAPLPTSLMWFALTDPCVCAGYGCCQIPRDTGGWDTKYPALPSHAVPFLFVPASGPQQ